MSKKLDISYEDAIKRLNEIVDELNSGETSLDNALNLFEEGTALTAHCSKILENAKAKIIEIEKE